MANIENPDDIEIYSKRNVQVELKTNYDDSVDELDSIFDNTWLKNTFLLADSELTIDRNNYQYYLMKNRYRTSADYKFTSTAPGMNLSCNPKPQFTRYADLRSKGKLLSRKDVSLTENRPGQFGFGLGRYYSRAIDDTAQRVYMTFGIQEFTSIITWMQNSFDVKRLIFSNRGMLTSTLLAGVSLGATYFALSATGLFVGLGLILNDKLTLQSRFYSVKPTPHLYWAAVEDIVNSLMSKRTLSPNTNLGGVYNLSKTSNKINEVMSVGSGLLNSIHELLPDIFPNKDGRVSIYALALKSQRAFNTMLKQDYEKNNETPTAADFIDYPIVENQISHDTYFTNEKSSANFVSRLFDYASKMMGVYNEPDENGEAKRSNLTLFDPMTTDKDTGEPIKIEQTDPTQDKDEAYKAAVQANIDKNSSAWQEVKKYTLDYLTDGALFAVFSVDSTGSVGESFSNSTTENPIQSTVNSISSKVRGFKNMFGGVGSSISSIPVLGDAISEVGSLIGDTAAVAASSATFGIANPLIAILYGVNFELAKVWDSSSTSFPRASYKMRLASPYGNPYSQLFNIYVPLAMLLAGSLPRGVGSQTYSSPFLCKVYDRGRVQTELGMIESLSVTRGTSNLPFTKKGQANAVDVDFTVANMDTMMFTDIATNGISDNPVSEAVKFILRPVQKDSAFNDYMSTIAGLDVFNQIYYLPKLRLRFAENYTKLGKLTDPAYYGTVAASRIPFMDFLLGNNGKVNFQAQTN